jgi:hypothetical protein
LKYQVTDAFSVVATFAYLWYLSYENIPRGYQASGVMLGYDIAKHFNLGFGVITERGTLNEQGEESFKFYDSQAARAVFDINLSF